MPQLQWWRAVLKGKPSLGALLLLCFFLGPFLTGPRAFYVTASPVTASQKRASLSCARVFSDHMVLPRGRRVPLWGTAAPGTEVVVLFAGQELRSVTNESGDWQVTLEPLAPSTDPTDLRINDIRIRDVLVGDVWFCSGQSNMRWRLDQSKGA